MFSANKLRCPVFITRKFRWCLLFELSVTVIVHHPSGITVESSYSVTGVFVAPIGLHTLYVIGPICMYACVHCIDLMFCLKYQVRNISGLGALHAGRDAL